MKRRRKYSLPPPARMGMFPPPLEIVELKSQRELAGEPMPPPVELIPLSRIEVVELQPTQTRPPHAGSVEGTPGTNTQAGNNGGSAPPLQPTSG